MRWSRIFNPWALAWVALGAAIAIAIIGAPSVTSVIWTDKAASWASALGTFAAVVVALYLGQAEGRHRRATAIQMARGAASVFNENLAMVQTFVLTVASMRARLHDETLTGMEVVSLSVEAKKLRPIIEDRFAPLVADLPPEVARLIVLADFRFRDFLANETIDAPGKREIRANVLLGFIQDAEYLGEAVAIASEATQALVSPGHPPAWRSLGERGETA